MQGFACVADYLLICRGRYLVCLVCQLRALQVCLQLFSCLVFRCLLLISVLLGALLSLSLRLQRSLTPFPILGRVTTRRIHHLFRVCQVVIAVRLYCRMVSAFSLSPFPCFRMFSLVHQCGCYGRSLFSAASNLRTCLTDHKMCRTVLLLSGSSRRPTSP